MDARDELSAKYTRSRDYSRLLEFPEFNRLVDEIRSQHSKAIEALSHLPSDDEHEKMVQIRYFNFIIGTLEKAAAKEPELKAKLENVGVLT